MIKNIKVIIYIALFALFASLSGYSYIISKKLQESELNSIRYKQNYEYYESKFSNEKENNTVLKLTVEELNNSKDSIIKELNKFKKESGIKKDKPGDTYIHAGGNINVSDTSKIKNDKGFELDTTIVFNEQTKSYIKIDSTGLINRLDIDFGMDFGINTRMEFKNNRKGWFDRLIHLDYKKIPVTRYKYKFNNDAIKPKNINVVVVVD